MVSDQTKLRMLKYGVGKAELINDFIMAWDVMQPLLVDYRQSVLNREARIRETFTEART